jgi:hypothetical protein
VRIERLRKAHGVRVKWVHFPLHPETPQEGRSLAALFAGRGYDVAKRQAEMRARMAAEGLPYGETSLKAGLTGLQTAGKTAENTSERSTRRPSTS